jgi:hypothetical protein
VASDDRIREEKKEKEGRKKKINKTIVYVVLGKTKSLSRDKVEICVASCLFKPAPSPSDLLPFFFPCHNQSTDNIINLPLFPLNRLADADILRTVSSALPSTFFTTSLAHSTS